MNELDLDTIRRRLREERGLDYWRSLDELAGSDAFLDYLRHEFPEGADTWEDPHGRRRFLKIMGASLALAGVGSGCLAEPHEKIVPYVDAPEETVPGEPLFFATAFPFQGFAEGVLVESHMGRPTKVEGNPDHPASLGSTSTWAQASVLDLYDPDRSTTPRFRNETATWEQFLSMMREERRALRADDGRGLAVLTASLTSPTVADQMEALGRMYPRMRWYHHDPVGREHERIGLRQALGAYRRPVLHLRRADVIVTLDADVLLTRPGRVRYARDFAARRRVREGETAMNRLYALESTPTVTGALADHRLPLRPSHLEHFAYALAYGLGLAEDAPHAFGLPYAGEGWATALVRDLQAHRGRSLIVAGEGLPPEVHALVHRMNAALGNVGETIEYIEPVEVRPPGEATSLRDLAGDVAAGRVRTLLVLGGNPAYTAPADVPFGDLLNEVPTTIHLSPYVDETSLRCRWHLPKAHYLEGWSDARAYDGTASILQPLIAPLHETARTEAELLSVLLGAPGRTGYDLVRDTWRRRFGGGDFAAFWQRALHDGVVPGTRGAALEGGVEPEMRVGAVPFRPLGPAEAAALPAREGARPDTLAGAPTAPDAAPPGTAAPDTAASDTAAAAVGAGVPLDTLPRTRPPVPEALADGLVEVVFRPDPTLWDGTFANNGWLQECPKPFTKLVWDNAALMSPDLAQRLGVTQEQVVELAHGEHVLRAGAWIVPGHADGTITLHLGHGREAAGHVGTGVGVSAYRLRPHDHPWRLTGVQVRPVDETYTLVSTQHHHSMEGRRIVEAGDVGRFRENPDFLQEHYEDELISLYPEFEYLGYKWGMVIDLNTCIGCNACLVACQAENNIPVVGKEEVRRGREMHWIRVDRYYKGDLDNPTAYFQPLPCMHCEKAPCEVVCPVYATVHDHEGLNVMVYNRCVGTRYCSNNCPYKVRRFNFLLYADWTSETLKMQRNPDVTVRSRGVMEKCTYCLQRISAARIRAKKEDRRIRDGEVMTACQTACPTQAIVFGDLNDEDSQVRQWHDQPHNYALLHELGTRPRTTYLARFQNPNPDVPKVYTAGYEIGETEEVEVDVGDGLEGGVLDLEPDDE